jgi:hypothetical protein
MSPPAADRLYGLLPAFHRIRDHAEGEPLRALMAIVEEELDRVDADVAGLYENWFIETCQEWVVPYIGDLLRVRPIHPVESARVTTRAYVANTIAYRRRKGTAVVLEQLARDVTGWPARVVEFFAGLATTQHLNHVRLAPAFTPAIRDAEAAELTGGAFDRFSHTLEVRRIASGRGRYNIPNVGLFLWRVASYPIGRLDDRGTPSDASSAREMNAGSAQPGRVYYTFHPLGLDSPLFVNPRVEETITHLAEEADVPGVLRSLALHEELETIRRRSTTPAPGDAAARRFMEPIPSFRVFVEWVPGTIDEVPPEQIFVCEIPDELELASPPIAAVAIDPERGRLALPRGAAAHSVRVTLSYGFPGDLGGGPYDRTASIDEIFNAPDWQRGVSHRLAAVPNQIVASLRAAVDEWHLQPPGVTGVIALMDSLEDRDAPATLTIRVPAQSRLLIVGGDWPEPRVNGQFEAADVRPHHVGDLVVHGDPGAGERGRLAINGLLLEGSLRVDSGDLGRLEVAHSTIDPHSGQFVVEGGNDDLRVSLTACITGPIHLSSGTSGLSIRDCLVVNDSPGSPDASIVAPESEVAIEQTTVFGGTEVRVLEASNSIFLLPVVAHRRQKGCARFSYIPPGSRTPRRHRCQPDTALAAADAAEADAVRRRVVPAFESRRFGDPQLGQLDLRTADEIRRGAEDGSEMGAYSFLKQPQREANLRRALDEYLRFGLEAGIFFVALPRRKEQP